MDNMLSSKVAESWVTFAFRESAVILSQRGGPKTMSGLI